MQKTDFVFYKILYTLWKLAVYYADLMGYEAPENPLQMHTELKNVGECSFIRIELPTYGDFDCGRMKEILQEYLTIVLLPQSEIPPYSDGKTVVESLYVFNAFYGKPEDRKLVWEFLYVNNPASYNLIRGGKNYD